MAEFTPALLHVVESPEQMKAFTDPLRVRVLEILSEREATNQQLADALGEPHAKVLHHVRTLLELGLVQLVDTRIKGGNVEKYYRAVARFFRLRPFPEISTGVVAGEFGALLQEVTASAARWPARVGDWEGRRMRMAPERYAEFHRRLIELLDEYWGGPTVEPVGDEDAPLLTLTAAIYRDPTDESPAEWPVPRPRS